jgi:hypothetical protein
MQNNYIKKKKWIFLSYISNININPCLHLHCMVVYIGMFAPAFKVTKMLIGTYFE